MVLLLLPFLQQYHSSQCEECYLAIMFVTYWELKIFIFFDQVETIFTAFPFDIFILFFIIPDTYLKLMFISCYFLPLSQPFLIYHWTWQLGLIKCLCFVFHHLYMGEGGEEKHTKLSRKVYLLNHSSCIL